MFFTAITEEKDVKYDMIRDSQLIKNDNDDDDDEHSADMQNFGKKRRIQLR